MSDLPHLSRLLSSWVFAALGALPLLIFVIAVIVGRRRWFAAELGMGFTPGDNALLSQFGGFAFFPHCHWKRATSVIRGTIQGLPVVFFDYHVTTGSNKNRNTTRLTVAAFDLASKPLPVFEAQGGRDWFTRLLDDALAHKGLDFHDDPDFTRSFCVTGDDAHAVRRLLGPGARSFMKRRTGWMFRSNGRWLLMCRLRKNPKPERYRAFVEEASEAMLVLTGARV